MSERVMRCFQNRKTELERQLETIYHKITLYERMLSDMKNLKIERELELAEYNNMIADITSLESERSEEH